MKSIEFKPGDLVEIEQKGNYGMKYEVGEIWKVTYYNGGDIIHAVPRCHLDDGSYAVLTVNCHNAEAVLYCTKEAEVIVPQINNGYEIY